MMVIDTNVLVRFVTNDDAHQSERAREAVSRGVILMANVLMEAEWVLRSSYGLPRDQVVELLSSFCRIETVSLHRPDVIERSLDAFEGGMNFADAVHLSAAERAGHASFGTFDKALVREARKTAWSLDVVAL